MSAHHTHSKRKASGEGIGGFAKVMRREQQQLLEQQQELLQTQQRQLDQAQHRLVERREAEADAANARRELLEHDIARVEEHDRKALGRLWYDKEGAFRDAEESARIRRGWTRPTAEQIRCTTNAFINVQRKADSCRWFDPETAGVLDRIGELIRGSLPEDSPSPPVRHPEVGGSISDHETDDVYVHAPVGGTVHMRRTRTRQSRAAHDAVSFSTSPLLRAQPPPPVFRAPPSPTLRDLLLHLDEADDPPKHLYAKVILTSLLAVCTFAHALWSADASKEPPAMAQAWAASGACGMAFCLLMVIPMTTLSELAVCCGCKRLVQTKVMSDLAVALVEQVVWYFMACVYGHIPSPQHPVARCIMAASWVGLFPWLVWYSLFHFVPLLLSRKSFG